MTKKTMRIISFLVIVLTVISCMSTAFAAITNIGGVNVSPVDANTGNLENVGGKVMSIIQTVGIIVAVVVLMVLGIKFMMGSAEEKAEYKKTFIPYIIGAVLIAAAAVFANMIYEFGNSI